MMGRTSDQTRSTPECKQGRSAKPRAGRKRTSTEAANDSEGQSMVDEDDEARPRKKIKTASTTTGAATPVKCTVYRGKYTSMKRVQAASALIESEYKECRGLAEWLQKKWKEYRMLKAQEVVKNETTKERSKKDTQQKQEQKHVRQRTARRGPDRRKEIKVQRLRSTIKQKESEQQLSLLKLGMQVKQMTETERTKGVQSWQSRADELQRQIDAHLSKQKDQERAVQDWLRTLPKHTLLLNDGALRLMVRTRSPRHEGASTRQTQYNEKSKHSVRLRLTTGWVHEQLRTFLSKQTSISIQAAHQVMQQLYRLVY